MVDFYQLIAHLLHPTCRQLSLAFRVRLLQAHLLQPAGPALIIVGMTSSHVHQVIQVICTNPGTCHCGGPAYGCGECAKYPGQLCTENRLKSQKRQLFPLCQHCEPFNQGFARVCCPMSSAPFAVSAWIPPAPSTAPPLALTLPPPAPTTSASVAPTTPAATSAPQQVRAAPGLSAPAASSNYNPNPYPTAAASSNHNPNPQPTAAASSNHNPNPHPTAVADQQLQELRGEVHRLTQTIQTLRAYIGTLVDLNDLYTPSDEPDDFSVVEASSSTSTTSTPHGKGTGS